MLLFFSTAFAASFSATSPDVPFDFLIPLDGSEVEISTTISVPDIAASVGDPSLDVDSAELTLEFYDLDLSGDCSVGSGGCTVVLYEYGTVQVDGVWVGDLYNGQNNANSVNTFTLPAGALAELAADGEIEVTLTLYATVSNPCGLSLNNTPESLIDATLEGEFDVNLPPVAAGHAEHTDADDSCTALVTLVSDSTDPNDDIVMTDWDFDQDGTWDEWGDTVQHAFDIGTHSVDMVVVDSWGEHAYATVTFTVEETAAEYSPVLSKRVLWPPDHSYHAVGYGVEGTYVCSGDALDASAIDWSLVGVTSDEPDDAPGGGDGHTTNDIVYKPNDQVFLRAERDKAQDGREYTFEFRVYDADGNVQDTLYDVVSVPKHLGCSKGCASESGSGLPSGAALAGLLGLVALRRRRG